MKIEIQKPEVVQRAQSYIKSGRFHDADELLTKAFDALDEKAPEPIDLAALRRKNFVELCDPVRGLADELDFSRNPSKGPCARSMSGFLERKAVSERGSSRRTAPGIDSFAARPAPLTA